MEDDHAYVERHWHGIVRWADGEISAIAPGRLSCIFLGKDWAQAAQTTREALCKVTELDRMINLCRARLPLAAAGTLPSDQESLADKLIAKLCEDRQRAAQGLKED